MAKCDRCNGAGWNDCPSCGGSGDYNKDGEIVICEACDGRGERCCTYCDDGEVPD